jgi:hypothetical protein
MTRDIKRKRFEGFLITPITESEIKAPLESEIMSPLEDNKRMYS